MENNEGIDLSVEFCGVKFRNPFVLASAPPTTTGGMIGRAFKAGWAGAVTKTLLVDASTITNVTPRLASLGFKGQAPDSKVNYALENIELVTDRDLAVWLKEIEDLKKKFPEHVIIASIMDDAGEPKGWQRLAKQCQEAGTDMIELNMSCPHGMPERGMGSAIGQDIDLAARVTGWVAEAVDIPVMAKMTPNVTDVGVVAKACVDAGADAISATNTVASIIGVDLETLSPLPSVSGYSAHGGLSGPAIKPIALKAVATIAEATDVPISGIGGITTWEDTAEFILLGASTLQVCTAVMMHGYSVVDNLVEGLAGFMKRKDFATISDMVGVSLKKLVPLGELDTKTRLVARIDNTICAQCDACFISCRDGGYQAITRGSDKVYKVTEKLCSGCSLCVQVCPIPGCISMGPKS
ncbi:MAG TPA: NAD-dependent dihydropyrimidine dehydrogenase subunit PreA [Deltaproteobacteria bacterium]|nr:NAD-dependent dihydropyrimidine dehydrogenase subunit PreA [Deltaproteobacteria bacterium]